MSVNYCLHGAKTLPLLSQGWQHRQSHSMQSKTHSTSSNKISGSSTSRQQEQRKWEAAVTAAAQQQLGVLTLVCWRQVAA